MDSINIARFILMREIGVSNETSTDKVLKYSDIPGWTSIFYLLEVEGLKLGFRYRFLHHLYSHDVQNWLLEEYFDARYDFCTYIGKLTLSPGAITSIKKIKGIILNKPQEVSLSEWLHNIANITYLFKRDRGEIIKLKGSLNSEIMNTIQSFNLLS